MRPSEYLMAAGCMISCEPLTALPRTVNSIFWKRRCIQLGELTPKDLRPPLVQYVGAPVKAIHLTSTCRSMATLLILAHQKEIQASFNSGVTGTKNALAGPSLVGPYPGHWKVQVDRWPRFYDFDRRGWVRWTDPFNHVHVELNGDGAALGAAPGPAVTGAG